MGDNPNGPQGLDLQALCVPGANCTDTCYMGSEGDPNCVSAQGKVGLWIGVDDNAESLEYGTRANQVFLCGGNSEPAILKRLTDCEWQIEASKACHCVGCGGGTPVAGNPQDAHVLLTITKIDCP